VPKSGSSRFDRKPIYDGRKYRQTKNHSYNTALLERRAGKKSKALFRDTDSGFAGGECS